MIELSVNDIQIKFSEEIFRVILNYIQDDNVKPEAGGILLGHYYDGFSFQVVDVSLPSRYDKASRFSFVRCRKNAQKIINKYFKKSNGKIIYLGEWHTHPEDVPTPSGIDKSSIRERLNKDVLNSDVIFTLILGRKGLYIATVNKDGIFGETRVKYEDINM